MSDPSPQQNVQGALWIVCCLCCLAMVYLSWRQSGEIEALHARLDTLSPPAVFPREKAEEVAPPYVPPDVLEPQTVEVPAGSVADIPREATAPVGPHPLIAAVEERHGKGGTA